MNRQTPHHFRRRHALLKSMGAMLMAALLCSCDLIYDYDTCPDEFRVRSDWQYAPDARPEGMAYMFFSTSTGDCWRYDFPQRSGGIVPIPDGEYRVLTFNDDTSRSIISEPDDGFDAMTVTSPEATLPQGDIPAKEERVISAPDQIWTESISRLSLRADGAQWAENFCPKKILTVFPRAIMPTYNIEITEISNLDGASRISAALTGMASGIRLSDGKHFATAATIPIEARRKDPTSIEGSGLTFGLPEEPDRPNILIVYIALTDGSTHSFRFDVTEQARQAPDPMNVTLKASGIRLPESEPAPDGAFEVSVDGWTEEIINIKHKPRLHCY